MQTIHSPRSEQGFTLIELLVVILIISVLAALVAPNVFRHVGASREAAVQSQFELFSAALDAYRLDNDSYPSTDQGLEALRRVPTGEPLPRNWRGPYLNKEVPLDPWGHPYVYRSPGTDPLREYEITSLGKDGREGGADEDADLQSWH